MIFIGIRKSGKPVKYFLAHKVDLSVYSSIPEITIIAFQRSSLWKYLMEDHVKFLDSLSEPGYKSPPKMDITFIDGGNIVRCYGVYITGSKCLDMDDWPDCKGIIDGRVQQYAITKIKESKIKKKIFLRAEKEFRQERIEGF
jgi:hypothetical protein